MKNLHAASALQRFMEWWSEEHWCAGWLVDLEYEMAKNAGGADGGAFEWLIHEAGGWWTWHQLADDVEFVEGSFDDLRKEAGCSS